MLKFLTNLRKMKSQSIDQTIPMAVLKDAVIAYLMPFDNRGKDIIDIDFQDPDLQLLKQIHMTIHYKKEVKSRTRKD